MEKLIGLLPFEFTNGTGIPLKKSSRELEDDPKFV